MRFSASSRPECELRRTNSYGSGSALQVFLGELNDSDIVTYRMQRGLVVCPHQNIVLPSPSAGFVLPAREARQLELSMTIENTVVDREVLALPLPLRRCSRPGEGTSQLTGTYSADTCKLECKLKYIWNTCHCVPYMFATSEFPPCRMEQLLCLTGLDVLKMVLPPFGFPNDAIKRRGLNCSHCIPTCDVVSYQFQTKTTSDRSDPRVTQAGGVSAYIDFSASAKMYKTKLNSNFVHRLTVMGSIAGLVMGVSMVSGVEALYYLLKTALVLAGPFLDLQGVQHRLQRLPVPRGLHWLHRLRLHRFNLVGRAKRLAEGLVKGQWSRRLKRARGRGPPPPPPLPPGGTQHL